MPNFLITGPDGKKYKVTAADENEAAAAIAHPTVIGGSGSGVPAGSAGTASPTPAAPAAFSPAQAARIAFDDPAPGAAPAVPAMPYGEQMRNVAGLLGRGTDQMVRATADGMTFGLADRLAAGGDMLTGGGSYSDNLAQERARTDAVGAGVPGLNTALKVGGGLLGGGGLVKSGLSLAANLPKGAGLLSRLAAFSGDGAIAGATDAIGHKDGGSLGDYADAARTGAEVGGAMGAALPAGAGLLGRATSAVSPFLAKPIEGANRITSGLIGALMSPQAMSTLEALGPDAAPIDASPSLLGLGQGVAAKPGAAADRVTDFVNARHDGQSDRLVGDLNANLGPAFSPDQITGLLSAKKAALSPLLEQADARGTMWNPQLEELAQRPAVQKALRSASDTAANEGRPLPMVSLDEQGREVSPSARAAYDSYTANARPRIDGALGELLGSDGALAKAEAIIAQRKAAADPLYAQFRSSNIPLTEGLTDLLQRPSVQSALPSAERLAQDEGKSIYIPQAGTADETGAPGASSSFGDEGRISRPAKPPMPRPQSLQDFVKSLGGVQDPRGDLKSMGLDSVRGLIAPQGRGLGPDAVRRAAAEMGYLGAHVDDAMANTDINDLYDALANHPTTSVRDADAVDAWHIYDTARAHYDQQGPSTMPARQITPEGWDYVKRALDDKISTAKRGGSNNEARVYTGLKTELTSALDTASPVYAQARQTFAGHSALLDALEQGKASIKSNVPREQLRREFHGLETDGERQMYRLGAAHSLREMVATHGDGPNIAAPIAGNQAVRDKLGTLAPSSDALDRFNQTIADTGRTFEEAQRPDVRGWRYALDDLAGQMGKATGDQHAAIGAAHGGLLDQLRTIEPFDRARTGLMAVDRGQQAFDIGRSALRGGDAAPWPADLARNFDALPLEQQALLRTGARSDIEQRFGQNRNDLSALLKIIGGENDFNRANMGTLFGEEPTKAMVDAAKREQAFASTRNTIAAGSRTAPMQAGSKAIDDATASRDYVIPKDATLMGLLGNAAEHAVRKGTGLLASMSNQSTRDQLAGLLTAKGPELDKLKGGLLAALAGHDRRSDMVRGLLGNPALLPAAVAGRRNDR